MPYASLNKNDPLSLWIDSESIRLLLDFQRNNAGLTALIMLWMAALLLCSKICDCPAF
jgi:hypothetical protein